jgi:hypothetical protein
MRFRIFHTLALIFLASLMPHSPATANIALPEFDGVYVFDVDRDEWIELRPAQMTKVAMATSIRDDQVRHSHFKQPPTGLYGTYIQLNGVGVHQFGAAPVVNNDRLRILIKARDLRLNFVSYMTPISAMQGSVNTFQQTGFGTIPEAPGELRPGTYGEKSPDVVLAGWGFEPSRFRVKTIDAFTQEFVLAPDFYWNEMVPGLSKSDCRIDCKLPAWGFAIHVVGASAPTGQFHIFATK